MKINPDDYPMTAYFAQRHAAEDALDDDVRTVLRALRHRHGADPVQFAVAISMYLVEIDMLDLVAEEARRWNEPSTMRLDEPDDSDGDNA